MSVFREAVNNLNNQSAYVLVGAKLIKAKTLQVKGDMVRVTLDEPIGSVAHIYVQIDNVVLADN